MNVFISYSDKDLKVAEKLASLLSEARMNVWLDRNEILLGDNWSLEQGKALQRSDAMVVLVSPDSVASETVRREVAYALSSPKFEGRVVPVVVRPTTDIPWLLRTMQMIHPQGAHGQAVKRMAEEIVDALAGPKNDKSVRTVLGEPKTVQR